MNIKQEALTLIQKTGAKLDGVHTQQGFGRELFCGRLTSTEGNVYRVTGYTLEEFWEDIWLFLTFATASAERKVTKTTHPHFFKA